MKKHSTGNTGSMRRLGVAVHDMGESGVLTLAARSSAGTSVLGSVNATWNGTVRGRCARTKRKSTRPSGSTSRSRVIMVSPTRSSSSSSALAGAITSTRTSSSPERQPGRIHS